MVMPHMSNDPWLSSSGFLPPVSSPCPPPLPPPPSPPPPPRYGNGPNTALPPVKQATEIPGFCKDFFNFSMRSRFSIDDSGAMVEFAMPAEARGLSRESSCGSGAPNLAIGGGKAPAAPPRAPPRGGGGESKS